jgi:quercetin dioxygenase-like cupin family protein
VTGPIDHGLNRPEGIIVWPVGEGGEVSPGTVLKAERYEGQGRLTLMERTFPTEVGSPFHSHHNMDEAWYIFEGELTYESGAWSAKAGPGAFVLVLSGTPHRYTVTSPGPARFLELFTVRGMEEFLRETWMQRTAHGPRPPYALVEALWGKYDMTLLVDPW